jgi:pimeloyl-ACP methyl ester carboxylesterase
MNQNSKQCWVAGFSFGAWIGMQLLMRRPEITGFVSVAPPANLYDFSFLAPCPSSGLIINGTADKVAPPKDTKPGRQAARAEGHHHHPYRDRGRGPLLQGRRGAYETDDPDGSDYVRRRMTEATR